MADRRLTAGTQLTADAQLAPDAQLWTLAPDVPADDDDERRRLLRELVLRALL